MKQPTEIATTLGRHFNDRSGELGDLSIFQTAMPRPDRLLRAKRTESRFLNISGRSSSNRRTEDD